MNNKTAEDKRIPAPKTYLTAYLIGTIKSLVLIHNSTDEDDLKDTTI